MAVLIVLRCTTLLENSYPVSFLAGVFKRSIRGFFYDF